MPNYDLTLTGPELDQALEDAQSALQPADIASGSITAKTGDLDFNSIGGLLPEDQIKLDNIEVGATADQTGAEIKALYEAEAETNAFTDAEKTKLTGIEDSATADQTAQEIATAIDDDAAAETTLKSALGLGTAAYTATGDYDPAGTATGTVGTHESTYAHADIATAVQEGDSRLTDARTPTSHAASHAVGQTDALTPAAIGAVATGDMPTAMSQAVAETGTSTTPQLISADVLKAGASAVRPLVDIVTASGNLTVADHNARWVITSGNVVVPHGSGSKGFYCEIEAGGLHTVAFDGTTSPTMGVGDVMTVYVVDDADGTPTIRAVLTAADTMVAFT